MARTGKSKRSDREKQSRGVARDYGSSLRQQGRALHHEISALRSERRTRLHAAASACRAKVDAHRELVKAERAALNANAKKKRTEIKSQCEIDRETARLRRELAEKDRELAALREHQATLRIHADPDPLGRGATRRTSAGATRRAESDDEVRANIPRELWPLFNKNRARFRDTEHRTRTEAFEEWAAEHPSLVEEAAAELMDVADDQESEAAYYDRMGHAQVVPEPESMHVRNAREMHKALGDLPGWRVEPIEHTAVGPSFVVHMPDGSSHRRTFDLADRGAMVVERLASAAPKPRALPPKRSGLERREILYYIVANRAPAGGFLPVLIEGDRVLGDEYAARGYDLNEAWKRAEQLAREDAERFVGDYETSVRPATVEELARVKHYAA